MVRLSERLKRILGKRPRETGRDERAPRRRDSKFVGGSSTKEIAEAPPGRAEELAGHAVERVDT